MPLGIKNRQAQTAELCKQHLRAKYPDKLSLVKEFIREVEGFGKARDITCWGSFTNIQGLDDETLKRVEQNFEHWLQPRSLSEARVKTSQ
jgi:hypothetical protein